MKIVVTGGAGFIGSALVRYLIGHTGHEVLVVDKLTYAGNLASLASVEGIRVIASAKPIFAIARPSAASFQASIRMPS